MRPRKRLVLFASDVLWASQIRFILETRLLILCAVTDEPEGVMELVDTGKCDGVLFLGEVPSMDSVLAGLPKELPTVLITKRWGTSIAICLSPVAGSGYGIKGNVGDTMELVMTVKLMLVKKRGPKKQGIKESSVCESLEKTMA